MTHVHPDLYRLASLTRPAVIVNGARTGFGAFAVGFMPAPGDRQLPGIVIPHLRRAPDFIYLEHVRTIECLISRKGRYVVCIRTHTDDPFAVPTGSHGLRNAGLN